MRILLVEDNPGDAALLREMLPAGGADSHEIHTVSRLADARRLLSREEYDAVLLDLSLPDSQGLQTLMSLHDLAGHTPLVVLTGLDDESLAMKAVEAGAQDYLVKGRLDKEGLAQCLRYAVARHRAQFALAEEAQAGLRGKVVGFLGAKGGVGVTTIALNVAVGLAQRNGSTILAEIHPTWGTLAAHVGRRPTENLMDLLQLDPPRLTPAVLGPALVEPLPGLRVLYGPQAHDEFRPIPPAHAQAIVRGLSELATCVVLDLPSSPADANQAAVGCCDVLGLVVEANRVGLAAAHKALETLGVWRCDRDRVRLVVVNRNSCSLGATPEEVAIDLACPLLGALPADAEGTAEALDLGLTVLLGQPDSPLARALQELTGRMTRQDPVLALGH